MSENVFQRILRHRPYEVLLTSTDEGYTVRLSKAGAVDRQPNWPMEPVRMTNPPSMLAPLVPAQFFANRVARRDELIGWILAELSRDAVEPVLYKALLPGEPLRSVQHYDFRLEIRLPRANWPFGTTIMRDDLADLDDAARGSWKVPSTQDDIVKW